MTDNTEYKQDIKEILRLLEEMKKNISDLKRKELDDYYDEFSLNYNEGDENNDFDR